MSDGMKCEITIKKTIGDTVYEAIFDGDKDLELAIWSDGRLKALLNLSPSEVARVEDFFREAGRVARLVAEAPAA